MSELPATFVPGFHDENEVRKMKYSKFGNTGLIVSHFSIGAAGFCSLFGDYSIDECKATLHEAIKRGINYIDTAPYYGNGVSEEVLGKCLEGIPRKAYYIATKVARYGMDPKTMFDFSAKKTRESIDLSLKKLGTGYIDVIQVHDVEFAPSPEVVMEETLPMLQEAVDQGKARFIGITGYQISVLGDIIKRSKVKIDTVLSFARLCLLDNAMKEYLPLFESKKLGIVNAAALCMGLLSSAGPQDWHPSTQNVRDVCTEARNYCQAANVELARLALYYSINQPGPHINLVGMNTRELLNTNWDVVQNGLTKKEKEVLQHLQTNIFTKSKSLHWERFEVEKYWRLVKE